MFIYFVIIIFLSVHDIALAIYVRFYSDGSNRTGFMGHACGAMAGLLVGVFILENRRVRSWEPAVQYISLGLFIMFVLFAVIWNIFADSWFPNGYYPKSDTEAYDDASGNCQHYDF